MTRPAAVLVMLMVVTLTACTSAAANPQRGSASGTAAGDGGCRPLRSLVAAHPDARSVARARSAMSAFAAVGWNPSAPPARPSTLTGGLFINYRPTWDGTNDPSANTNIQTTGASDDQDGNSPRHDPLTDLAVLRNIDALQSTGVKDAGMDALRCRLQPVTEAEFATYGVERGWVYNEMIDLSQLDSNGPWSTQARTFAALLAKRFADGIDPTKNFRPDWVAESAAALTEAGTRFGQPDWTSTGRRLALDLCRRAANPTTGFFPGQARMTASGPATVTDPLVKIGSQAQLLDALLSVYDDSHDPEILVAVTKSLASLQSAAVGVADVTGGGWFYGVDVDGTNVRKAYKETRQAWLVGLFRHAAKIGLISTQVSDTVLAVVRDQLYQPNSRGYVYRVRSNWTPYITTQEGKRIEENWVSSEATGIAIAALLGPLT